MPQKKVEDLPNDNKNIVPRLGRFALPMLTLFASNPAFATIVASPEAATNSLTKDAAIGIVTYSAAYWFDPVAFF